jgi:hypothetical protein
MSDTWIDGRKIDELDVENDVYDSLAYGYLKHGESYEDTVSKDYIDSSFSFANVEDEDVVDKIKETKRGNWLGNSDYGAIQPAFRILCEKKTPYRNIKEICEIEDIMAKDPDVFFNVKNFLFALTILVVPIIMLFVYPKYLKPKKKNKE